MKKQILIPLVMMFLLAMSCKKVVPDPIPTKPSPPEQLEPVANAENPQDKFGVFHNKGMHYMKGAYSLSGDYDFIVGHETVVGLLRKWVDEIVKDKEFLEYCKTDAQTAQKSMYQVLDSMMVNPQRLPGRNKRVPVQDADINALVAMGPFIDFSLDKLDSFLNKQMITQSGYYKGIKVIEKDYMITPQPNPKTGRYLSLIRYSTDWVCGNMADESKEVKYAIVIADMRGALEEWGKGGGTADMVLGAIASSASAALNKGKY